MPRLKRQKIKSGWSLRTLKRKQNEAANEVCHTLLLMVSFSGLDIPEAERKFFGEPFGKWSDLTFYIKDRQLRNLTPNSSYDLI